MPLKMSKCVCVCQKTLYNNVPHQDKYISIRPTKAIVTRCVDNKSSEILTCHSDCDFKQQSEKKGVDGVILTFCEKKKKISIKNTESVLLLIYQIRTNTLPKVTRLPIFYSLHF